MATSIATGNHPSTLVKGTVIDVSQVAHGLTVLDCIYHNGTDWVKAKSDDGTTLVQFMVTSITDVDRFIAYQFGEVKIVAHGMDIGYNYFSSETVSGGVTATEPISGYSSPVFYVKDVDTLIVNIYRPHGVDTLDAPLNGLKDVTITAPIEGEALIFNNTSGEWENSGQVLTNTALINARPNNNILINGDMRVNQRGILPITLNSSGSYTIDRWVVIGNIYNRTISQETTSQPTQLSGSNSIKDIYTGANTSGKIGNEQRIEDYSLYEGKTVTFSAYVKSNNSDCRLEINYNLSGNWAYSSPHSGIVGWERLTVTTTLPSGITALSVGIRVNDGIANGDVPVDNNDYIEFTGAKLELGSTATEFIADSYGESLRKCERYATKVYISSSAQMDILAPATTARVNVDFALNKLRDRFAVLEDYVLYIHIIQAPEFGSGVTFGDEANWTATIDGSARVTLERSSALPDRSFVSFNSGTYFMLTKEL